jgi:hypothetical protein
MYLIPNFKMARNYPSEKKQSQLGSIYLGNRPSIFGLIGNLDTGAVSPHQYHIIYNELFTSVHSHLTDTVFDSKEWNNMLNLKSLEYNVDPINDPGDQLPPFSDEFVNGLILQFLREIPRNKPKKIRHRMKKEEELPNYQ